MEIATYLPRSQIPVVGEGQIIVDGFGNMNRLDGVAHLRTDLCTGQVSAGHRPVIKVSDVVRPEHIDEALVLGPILVETFELVAA